MLDHQYYESVRENVSMFECQRVSECVSECVCVCASVSVCVAIDERSPQLMKKTNRPSNRAGITLHCHKDSSLGVFHRRILILKSTSGITSDDSKTRESSHLYFSKPIHTLLDSTNYVQRSLLE